MSNQIKISFKSFIVQFISKGFVADIFFAYRGLKTSFDRQLSYGYDESRLLAYCFFISFILFLERLPFKVSKSYEFSGDYYISDKIGMDLFASLFFVPIFLYLLSCLLHIFCLPFGQKTTFFETRLAFFWSTIVVSPLLLLFSILQVIFYDFYISTAFSFISILCYAWVFSSLLCYANKIQTNIYLFLLLISAFFLIYLISNS